MDPKTYQSILRQLDFRPRFAMLALQCIVDGGLMTAIYLLLTRGGSTGYWAAQAVLPLLFFRGFSLMHEAVHHNVSKSSLLNDVVGFWGGLLCVMPYHSWRRLHLEHHYWAGNVDQDPSNKLRKDYDPSKRVKYRILTAIWKSWVPIMGLLQEIVFWIYPAQQLKNPRYSARAKAAIVFSVVSPAAVYFVLFRVRPDLFNLVNFGPAYLFYLMWVELVNFPHHMDVEAFKGDGRLALKDQYRVTRSSYYPSWFARFFFLNFNLHTEHHLYPTLPWYQLDRARALIKSALGDRYNESTGNAWIVKNRKLNLETLLPVTQSAPPVIDDRKAA